jgi:dihydrofolate synthase/folylpolyglutamate synthase
MADRAVSSDPAVQQQLDRLAALSPGADVLGLERITALLGRLGNPHDAMPPVFHVAGTNGKGSTCAFLRAALDAAGYRVHAYTSPHLVRFNERIRVADRLIDDETLAATLGEVLDHADGIEASFFEITTAAAFLIFSRVPADACIVEVGLGGRLDATNVIARPLITGIAQLGIDHQSFLGHRVEQIAAEKAGIAKPGAPMITLHYPSSVAEQIGRAVRGAATTWRAKGAGWDATVYQNQLHYTDATGPLDLPLPRLPGAHQSLNAALAVAMLRHQHALPLPEAALRAAMGWAEWPARLQRLAPGPLVDQLPQGSELWLDGGHNPAAARAIADFFRGHVPAGRPFHIVLGMLANKDVAGVLRSFAGRAAVIHGVRVPGHDHHAPASLAEAARAAGFTAREASAETDALGWIGRHADRLQPPIVLVMGSLYLAGRVLEANGQIPD